MGQIISVFSPKGGVGKTTLTLALAEVLQKEGKTLVIEFDFSPGDFATLLDVDKNKNIEAACVYGLLSSVQKPQSKEYYVVAGGFPEVHEKIDSKQLKKIISEAKNEFDFVLFDIQPGLVERAINVLSMSDRVVVIVENNQQVILRFARILRYLSTRMDLSRIFVVVNKAIKGQKFCLPEDITGGVIPWCGKLFEPWDKKIVFHVEKLKQKLFEHEFTDIQKLIGFTNEILKKYNIENTRQDRERSEMIYIMTKIQSLDDILKSKFADFVTEDITKSRIQVLVCEDKQKIDEAAQNRVHKIVLTSPEFESYAYEKGFKYVFAGAIELPKIISAIEDLISQVTGKTKDEIEDELLAGKLEETKKEPAEEPDEELESESAEKPEYKPEEKTEDDLFAVSAEEDSKEELFAQDLQQKNENEEGGCTVQQNMQEIEAFASALSQSVSNLIFLELKKFLEAHIQNEKAEELLEENQKLKEKVAELEKELNKLCRIKELIKSLAGGLDE
ncbi:chromosome partitioning ATPase [Caldicellulosiruptor acetigenus I77R1B]|uniref:Chromosome partitioning ATPase n=1 Tax=Caldicellulosiruptor acetigenus (strain ATCC 700853 / DSM 12137 / I77R1B) TaxID=632335 RepID=E4S5R4_CALA7|nr:AAA family ATPase [Caldicellulosiruptor acetigenus]ADQ41574.1 chromosome partitioning ATPase [Caldicellulosiruptor acetigenus I77R1B]